MNKLTMSKKEENNNYNLIIENINKLVDMCGNTKEAIELRDNLFNLFTTKYSEPLYDVLGLQEQIGCPLDVLFKAITYGIAYELKNGLIESEPHIDLAECGYGYILCTGSSDRKLIENGEFQTKDYKQTWWLKEDRSE